MHLMFGNLQSPSHFPAAETFKDVMCIKKNVMATLYTYVKDVKKGAKNSWWTRLVCLFKLYRESLTKEAVDNPEEAAHGANDRRHNLVSPLNLLVTPQQLLAEAQQLASGRHGGPKFRWGRARSSVGRLCEWTTGSGALDHSNVSICQEVEEEEAAERAREREGGKERGRNMRGKVIIDFLLQVLTQQ